MRVAVAPSGACHIAQHLVARPCAGPGPRAGLVGGGGTGGACAWWRVNWPVSMKSASASCSKRWPPRSVPRRHQRVGPVPPARRAAPQASTQCWEQRLAERAHIQHGRTGLQALRQPPISSPAWRSCCRSRPQSGHAPCGAAPAGSAPGAAPQTARPRWGTGAKAMCTPAVAAARSGALRRSWPGAIHGHGHGFMSPRAKAVCAPR